MMKTEKIATRATVLPNWREEVHAPLANAALGLTDVLLTGGGEWSTEIPMPEHLIEAACQAVRGRPQYTSEYGLSELQAAIARKLADENGITVNPTTEVLVTNGATEAISCCMLALVEPGDEIIVGDPYYMAIYKPNALMNGGHLVTVENDREAHFRFDPERVRAAITPRTKLLVLTSPDNPTGACLPRETLQELARVAEEHDLIVLSDEIYEKFVYDGNSHVSMASLPGCRDRTVVINGFSKTYGLTGYRVGYVAGPRSLVREIAKVRSAISLCANEVSQRVALAALDGPQDWLPPIIDAYAEARNILVEGLGAIVGVDITPPDGAIYVFPHMGSYGLSSMEMSKYLLRRARVATRPGSYFGPSGEGYVRFNIAPNAETARAVVERVGEALSELKRTGHT
jgi:aspartate/methionine/tyrosine aminotransferase